MAKQKPGQRVVTTAPATTGENVETTTATEEVGTTVEETTATTEEVGTETETSEESTTQEEAKDETSSEEIGGDDADSNEEKETDTAPTIITGDEEKSSEETTLTDSEDSKDEQIQEGTGDSTDGDSEEAAQEELTEKSSFEKVSVLTSTFKGLLRESYRYRNIGEIIDTLVEKYKDKDIRVEFEDKATLEKFIDAVEVRGVRKAVKDAIIEKVSSK